jgi:hypothetical protein
MAGSLTALRFFLAPKWFVFHVKAVFLMECANQAGIYCVIMTLVNPPIRSSCEFD